MSAKAFLKRLKEAARTAPGVAARGPEHAQLGEEEDACDSSEHEAEAELLLAGRHRAGRVPTHRRPGAAVEFEFGAGGIRDELDSGAPARRSARRAGNSAAPSKPRPANVESVAEEAIAFASDFALAAPRPPARAPQATAPGGSSTGHFLPLARRLAVKPGPKGAAASLVELLRKRKRSAGNAASSTGGGSAVLASAFENQLAAARRDDAARTAGDVEELLLEVDRKGNVSLRESAASAIDGGSGGAAVAGKDIDLLLAEMLDEPHPGPPRDAPPRDLAGSSQWVALSPRVLPSCPASAASAAEPQVLAPAAPERAEEVPAPPAAAAAAVDARECAAVPAKKERKKGPRALGVLMALHADPAAAPAPHDPTAGDRAAKLAEATAARDAQRAARLMRLNLKSSTAAAADDDDDDAGAFSGGASRDE